MLNPNKYKRISLKTQIIFGLGLLSLSIQCAKENKHAAGESLAKIHCGSCHMFPEPGILPRRVWGEKILPNMGLKMGMSHGPIYAYGNSESTQNLEPLLSQEDWDRIVHFYLNRSENSIPKNNIQDYEASTLFESHIFQLDSFPLISMTSYNEQSGKLFLGNGSNSKLLTLDLNGDVLNVEKLESPPVKIIIKDSLDYLLTIGHLNPSDEASGRLRIGTNAIEGLIRPVDFLIHDFNVDGYDDVLVCNYGNNVGDFSWYENLGNGSYNKKVLQPMSGAIKVELTNMDSDADDEIVVLFAQEHEMIMIWDYDNNILNGKKVIQFQPAFGAVDFQLKDMNGDGLKDIIIGNGDNSDLSTVLKNYHGIRVLINKGGKEFTEGFFMPIHGISKIRVEDFDMDGDTDILTISNFGDFTDPKFKSVQLLMNEGELKFKPKYINALPDFRWQTLDVSDYDKDGDLDVFIGSFNFKAGPEESNISDKENISWVKLENKTN